MSGEHINEDSYLAHEIKAEEIKRLYPYYTQHRLPYLLRPFSQWIFGTVPVVDTSTYEHLPLENYSQSQIVDRTIFALQKLNQLNPKFFTPQEQRILNPLPNGVVSYGMNTMYSFMNALYFCYIWKTKSFNVKAFGLWAFFLTAQTISLQFPNLLCETLIQWPRRRFMAKQYLEVYGPEYFHKIIDPRFSVHTLETLQNIA